MTPNENLEVLLPEKEPFYRSVRFWVAVLAPIVTALLQVATERVPFLMDLDSAQVTLFTATWVVAAVSYIFARTIRNTPARWRYSRHG